MKKIALSLLKSMSTLSLGISRLSANTASSWIAHQAEEPQALKKLKKIIQVQNSLSNQERVFVFKEEI